MRTTRAGAPRFARAVATLAAVGAIGALLAACELPGMVLQGRLLDDATSQPAAGAPVAVYDAASETVVAETTTSSTGWYHFAPGALPDGTYRIRFATDDWWEGASTWADATDVAASAAAPARIDATIDLATGSLVGTVTDGDDPIAGATVEARSTVSGAFIGAASTGPDGTYAFPAIATGSYHLRASAPGRATTYLGDTPSADGAAVVEVDEDAEAAGGAIELPAESTIVGTVLDGDDPAAGVQVLAHQVDADEPAAVATTGPDGSFGVAGLAAATYHLTLLSPSGAVAVNDGTVPTAPLAVAVPIAGSAHIGTVDLDTGSNAASPTPVIAAGRDLTCAIDAHGHLACWGLGSSGQTAAPAGTFVDVAVATTGSFVAAHGCAISTAGAISCWGPDGAGQASPPGGSFTSVAVRASSSCAVSTSGAVDCWGAASGTEPSGSFRRIAGGEGGFCAIADNGAATCWGGAVEIEAEVVGDYEAIAIGRAHACGLRVDGAVACWGAGTAGSTTAPPGTHRSVSATGNRSCAAATSGAVTCWGAASGLPPTDLFTSLSSGSSDCGWTTTGTVRCWSLSDPTGSSTPPQGSYTAVTLGGDGKLCARRTDGEWRCTGFWSTLSSQRYPNPPEPVGDLGIGFDVACGVRPDGTLVCWGSGPAAQKSPPPGTFAQVDTRDDHSCAVATDQSLACWGDDDSGKASPPPGTYTVVGVGAEHSCALAADQSIACWGSDADGRSSPPSGAFTSISVGPSHSCAVAVGGSVECWGSGATGATAPPPGQFTALSADHGHTCGLRVDGTLACWGTGGFPTSTVPPAGGGFTGLSDGATSTTCALRADGSYTCWGYLGVSGWLH